MDINKYIAKQIVFAQSASNVGKDLFRDYDSRGTLYCGYDIKPQYIKRAIDAINSTSKTRFTYYVVSEPDQNGYASILVYFEWKGPLGLNQVSFHNPPRTAPVLGKYLGKGTPTGWNGIRGGSLRAVEYLVRQYHL